MRGRVGTMHRVATLAISALVAGGCQDRGDGGPVMEEPALLTTDLPFQYPPDLFAARVEGDVGLRLYVDSLGLVVPDSTAVVEPSSRAEFDSAAVAGAPYLEFRPARVGGARVGRVVVLPVRFRLPTAAVTDSQRRDTLRKSR